MRFDETDAQAIEQAIKDTEKYVKGIRNRAAKFLDPHTEGEADLALCSLDHLKGILGIEAAEPVRQYKEYMKSLKGGAGKKINVSFVTGYAKKIKEKNIPF